jgi:transposase
MGKAKHKHPRVKRIELKAPETRAFLHRVKDRALVEQDYELIEGMVATLKFLSQAVEDNAASIKRLLGYLFGAPTETAKKIFPEDDSKKADPSKDSDKPREPRKGHGRLGADSYTGGRLVKLAHPTLTSGDPCPECPKGKVYELALPSTVVKIVGGAPLQATVYELSRLRCNLCGQIFTTPAPVEANQGKYDDSAPAMIAVLKYGCGMPFYRLEKLQESLGMPVPASTQWEILDEAVKSVEPAFEALVRKAAAGDILHNDDTTAKILSLLEEQNEESERKGIFTTGIVSVKDDRQIAIFMTGRNHAGENLRELLKDRAKSLAPPIQMCDASSRNVPKEFQTILANCLAHARRQFADVAEAFPEECRQVIDLLGKVYYHDGLARERKLDPDERLAFHQEKSGPVMGELKTWCDRQISEKLVEPNSGIGKAIQYLLNHWEKLTRFLKVPNAPLDNNICERALKRAVLNRKNSLFFKTENGAHVGDVFLSLIHTCQLSGENPFDYLTRVVRNAPEVARAPDQWLPWNYRENLKPD